MTFSTVELPAPPRLGPLYRSAVLRGLRPPGGSSLPDETLLVRAVGIDRAHLTGYDRACGFRLTDLLPATYPHVLAFPLAVQLMTGPGFPLPLVGLVHVANRIEVHRPVTADERFDIRVHAEDLRPHPRGRQVDLVAVATVGDETVWTGRSTYLRKEKKADGTRPESAPSPVGITRWRVTARTGTDYADVSGDQNPIHTSRIGARLFGFPGPIAHGMWAKARCLAALEGRLPDRYTVDVAFKLPIPLPSTVAFGAVATDDGWLLDLRAARSGKPHLAGTIDTLP
jgi:acyl dehydratase